MSLFSEKEERVDFITFNVTKLSDSQIYQLAAYFQSLGFNCYLKKAETSKSRQEVYNKNHLLTLFSIIWICKPIPYENVVHHRNQFVRQEILVLRAGGQDSTDNTFVPPNTGSRRSTSSGQQNSQPKPQKDQTNANIGQKLTYKQPGDPGGFGAGNIDEDLPEIPDLKDTISDSEFWDKVQNQEPEYSENELNPKEAPVSSQPTYKLTKESIKENDFLDKQPQPLLFKDWEGDEKIIKGKELKKISIFSWD